MSETIGEREQQVNAILAAYLQAVDAGKKPDPDELLRQHPALADELRAFFADQAKIDGLAASLRAGPVPGADATLASADSAPPVGTTLRYFGDYELLEELARGGMGVVYKARQVSLNRVVALKMILTGRLASPAEVQRFQLEAEAAANLDHPNLVPIHEVGQREGQHYFSMKLIDGGSLATRANKERGVRDRHDQEQIASLLAKVARAVHHAHQRGILHRDLKPGNILIDAEGEPHITDFGLAKRLTGDSSVTNTGAILGTPSYMAPEQADGKAMGVTTAADLYSLGAILYELLTGRPPFRGETVLETLRLLQEQAPELPSRLSPAVNRDMETICLKCLEKDPQRRYTSAAALAEDLEHWLADEPISARAVSPLHVMWVWVRKNLRTALVSALIGFVCFGLGTGLVSLYFIDQLLANAAKTYANFPSLTPSWVITSWVRPPWLAIVSLLVGFVLVGNLGLATYWFVRPRDRTGDVVAGLATGLIGGINAYLFGLGWGISLILIVVPSISDLFLYSEALPMKGELAKAPATLDLGEVLSKQYPDLAVLPPRKRVDVMAGKIISDQVAACLVAIWVGIVVVLGLHIMTGVVQTMAAGYVLRRGERLPWAWIPYLELTVPAQAYAVLCMMWIVEESGQPGRPSLGDRVLTGVMISLMLVLGLVGVSQRWRWPLRMFLYACVVSIWCRLLGGVGIPGANFEFFWKGQFPWYIDVTAWVGVVVLLASYYERRGAPVHPRAGHV